MYKNTVTPIIVILDHLELDIKVSDANIETTESNDCRGLSRDNRSANGMLAII